MFHVAENQPIGSHVGSVSAVDRDETPRDQFIYVIDSPLTSFQIDRQSGLITTSKTIDRERQSLYHLKVIASACGVNETLVKSHQSTAIVTINVNDVNDNRPVFIFPRPGNDTLRLTVNDSTTYHKPRVSAYDLDRGVNAPVSYTHLTLPTNREV